MDSFLNNMEREKNGQMPEVRSADKGVILLVESGSSSSQIEQQINNAGGYRIDLAADKSDAMGKLEQGEYDILIADWNSLAADGPDLLGTLKSRFRATKVFIVNCDSPQAGQLLMQGAAGALPQPIHWESFIGHLTHVAKDQRFSHRFSCRPLACRLWEDGTDIIGCGYIKNISADGAMLWTEYDLPNGIHLDIELFLPDGRSLKTGARVIRGVSSDPWRRNRVPVYFDDERNLDLLLELAEFLV